MRDNIYLIGFMGTGKTTVGELLAKRLGWAFVDVDREIENSMAISIPSIFRIYGEAFFRQREHQALRALVGKKRLVVATGGGIVSRCGNMGLMMSSGTIICLRGSAKTIMARVGSGKGRPMLKADDLLKRIEELLAQREKLYNQADVIVDIDDKEPMQVVEEIMDRLGIIS